MSSVYIVPLLLMNYLAHAFLSCNDPDLLIGNLICDMVKPRDMPALDPRWESGLQLHRFIDSYADEHEANREAVRIIRSSQGKYAPVSLDIYQDYLLHQSWDLYTEQEYGAFAQMCYSVILLEPTGDFKPLRRLQSMANAGWLRQYQTLEALQTVFDRMQKRTKFRDNFATAVADLTEHEDELMRLFRTFFPQMIAAARDYCFCDD